MDDRVENSSSITDERLRTKKENLAHLAASLEEAKKSGGATLLVGAGISVSAGIPPANTLIKKAIEKYPRFFTDEERNNPSALQYNHVMQKLSNVHRKELFKPYIASAKLNFAHIAIAELLKQGYISRILTVNFDPLLIHACYMVGMYPFPAIYDLGAVNNLNAELLNDPCIVYLNGQHVGFVQRNTPEQFKTHQDVLTQIVRSTGCTKPWIVAGYSGENDPLMTALSSLRPYNNWLYWLEYSNQLCQEYEKIRKSHQFLEQDEECKIIYGCDADEIFLEIADLLGCNLDFIERPDKELVKYLNEIDFKTAHKKGRVLQAKVQNYITILQQSSLNELFEKTDNLYQIFLKHISELGESVDKEQNLRLAAICEQYFPLLRNSLDGEFFYWWAAAYSTLAEYHSIDIGEKEEKFKRAIQIYKQGIQQDPSYGGNFHFCGYCELQLAKLTENRECQKQLLNQSIIHFKDSWDACEHVMYSLECYLLLNDFNALINYFEKPEILEIVKKYKRIIFQNEYIEPLLRINIFCDWYQFIFGEPPTINNIRLEEKETLS